MSARVPSMDPFGASMGLPWAPLSSQSTPLGPILVALALPGGLSGPPMGAFEPLIALPGRSNGHPWITPGPPLAALGD